jgi:hypothetical protein
MAWKCSKLIDVQGISAVPMGAILAARAGFETRELVRVNRRRRMHDESDEPNAEDSFELCVAIRQPSSSAASDESATSLDSEFDTAV